MLVLVTACANPGGPAPAGSSSAKPPAAAKKQVGNPDERTLTGAEIKKRFSGHTVRGRHERHGYEFESYYDEGGTFRSYQGGGKTPRKAKWWTRGNDICIRWEDQNPPGDLCRKMVVSAKGKYRKLKLTHDGRTIPIVTFESFEKGNPKKL